MGSGAETTGVYLISRLIVRLTGIETRPDDAIALVLTAGVERTIRADVRAVVPFDGVVTTETTVDCVVSRIAEEPVRASVTGQRVSERRTEDHFQSAEPVGSFTYPNTRVEVDVDALREQVVDDVVPAPPYTRSSPANGTNHCSPVVPLM